MYWNLQWPIEGKGPRGLPPQCLDQTDRESRRPKKKKHLEGLFFEPKSSHTRFNVFFPLPFYCESYLVIREISNSVVIWKVNSPRPSHSLDFRSCLLYDLCYIRLLKMKNHLLNSVLNKLRQFAQFWLFHLFYLKCAMLNNVKNKSGSNQNADFVPRAHATHWTWALQEDTQSWETLLPL